MHLRTLVLSAFLLPALAAQEDPLLPAFHAISSHRAMDHVRELCDPKYAGRLTGTPEYDACARWCAERLASFGVRPGAADGTWFQRFPDPYTLLKPGCELALRLPVGGDVVQKRYAFQEGFFPGGTTDAGTVTAEAVYVGYGITAPELGFDEYAGLEVKGKVVVLEPEGPVGTADPELFRKWRPYTFHDYKTRNALAHGAAAVVFDYLIANPNNVWHKGLLTAAVGQEAMDDLFAGTGRRHRDTVAGIRRDLRPASFATGKQLGVRMVSEHHPEGVGSNVVGILEGTDSALRSEAILIGAHLDHLGLTPELIPGANDNASSCAVLLLAAEALAKVPMRRSVVFVLFGAEEQGVRGSEFYVQHPTVPLAKLTAMLNLESVGRGEHIRGDFGKLFPDVWRAFEKANERFVHRVLRASAERPIARPRQDALHFLWAGVPTIGFGAGGAPPLPFPSYHTTHDRPEHLTPGILEDLARLVFLGTVELAGR